MSTPIALEINWDDLNQALSSDVKPRLVDCREADEYAICKIDGAELIPLSNFVDEAVRRLGPDRDQWIVVYCHHGVRSMRATAWLRQQGYSRTQSLRGGIDTWADCVDPEMARY